MLLVNEAEPAPAGERGISFGPFRLFPRQRLLLEGDKPVRLGSRALEILVALVEHPGEVVGKDELMARVWPNTIVDEGNLKFQVSALRRTLGGGTRYLVTVPGRGYSFAAPVARTEETRPEAPQATATESAHNLPAQLTRLIGRAETVSRLAAQLPRQRLLTIVGPGGIGKTSVALAVAETLIATYQHGVWLIDLSPFSDPRLVPGALAAVLGIEIRSDNPLLSLVVSLRDNNILILLDNCEHVIDVAAGLAIGILKGTPGVHILATSREPLRVEGERVHRLSSLPNSPASAGLTAAEALAFPAVQLFVERAAANLGEFELSDTNAPLVVDICGKLDGIPLAIEFAAARVEALGVHGLASRLDERLRLLTSGRRTALPRHRTLSAVLNWSYEQLPKPEAAVLRCCSTFAREFSLDAALAVAGDLPEPQVADDIANLVDKSLIVADLRNEVAQYRLLDTTRLYASGKARSTGEFRQAARRHAEYFCGLFADAEAESESRPQDEWLAIYGRHLDNVRAGLDWAFSAEGDPPLGVALTIAVVPLWVQLSLFGECRERVERALASLAGDAAATGRPRIQLSAALAWSLMYGVGRAREAGPAWATTLELAEGLNDKGYQQRALWGLCIDQFNNGEFRTALEFARRFADLVANSTDPIDLMMADRLLATALHYFGNQGSARHHIDRALAQLAALAQQPQIVRVRFDMRVSTHYFQARIM
jgi:predicted ATPase/DNA-binding winged helix-turn-helix (wHTH) protein